MKERDKELENESISMNQNDLRDEMRQRLSRKGRQRNGECVVAR